MDKQRLVITFSNRADFQSKYGHDVSPLPEIQSLNPQSEIGFIPHHSFWKCMDYMLQTYAINEHELTLLHARLHDVVSYSSSPYVHANENRMPHTTRRCTRLHDDIQKSLDTKLLCLAYFMKVSEFMPMVANRYGPCYTYSASTSTGQHFESYVLFDELMTLQQMKAHVDETIHTVHENLDYLRSVFTDHEKEKRKEDNTRDYFCAAYHGNREMDRMFAYDRIEVLFMKEYGFPLGLFETTPEVSKSLAKNRNDENYAKSIQHLLLKTDNQIGYPGIQLNRTDTSLTLKEHVRRALSRGCFGPIPKTGLNLADSGGCITKSKQARKKALSPR